MFHSVTTFSSVGQWLCLRSLTCVLNGNFVNIDNRSNKKKTHQKRIQCSNRTSGWSLFNPLSLRCRDGGKCLESLSLLQMYACCMYNSVDNEPINRMRKLKQPNYKLGAYFVANLGFKDNQKMILLKPILAIDRQITNDAPFSLFNYVHAPKPIINWIKLTDKRINFRHFNIPALPLRSCKILH